MKVKDTNFLNKYAYEDHQCRFYLLVGIKCIFFFEYGIETTFLNQFILVGCSVGVEFFCLCALFVNFNHMVVVYGMISYASVYISDKYTEIPY